MNALQRLIANYLADHPGESYASIGKRGGLHRSTVQSLATTERRRQTPHPDTITGLAKGMGMLESTVRSAAGDSAGYRPAVPAEMDTEEGRLIIEAFGTVDEERQRELARRARFLLEEFAEEESRRKRRKPSK